ncbi:hypothetical protein THAOC_06149 [Thalassiosira oceanica]|uniref:Histone acetyltransferase n=1 Tax=Thalassiosira oceanica TaxID=159749 RepID=K0TM16_THAOC|nr:hypothetical protein THAOC_06149 [Thalassiosira oceanica]|eukprot:EJK72332.1 hypothetical protein THAOC_06149 [Thalassiosira oceanica]
MPDHAVRGAAGGGPDAPGARKRFRRAASSSAVSSDDGPSPADDPSLAAAVHLEENFARRSRRRSAAAEGDSPSPPDGGDSSNSSNPSPANVPPEPPPRPRRARGDGRRGPPRARGGHQGQERGGPRARPSSDGHVVLQPASQGAIEGRRRDRRPVRRRVHARVLHEEGGAEEVPEEDFWGGREGGTEASAGERDIQVRQPEHVRGGRPGGEAVLPEPVLHRQALPRPQDTVLRRRSVPVLRALRGRQSRTPHRSHSFTTNAPTGYHPVGYYSKEKYSDVGYNLACILTFPAHQRKGYGRFLIAFSYELSKKEEKVGSPEKPMSDLGQQAYIPYWTSTIVDFLLHGSGDRTSMSVMDIARRTSIMAEDIIFALNTLGILKFVNGVYFIAAREGGPRGPRASAPREGAEGRPVEAPLDAVPERRAEAGQVQHQQQEALAEAGFFWIRHDEWRNRSGQTVWLCAPSLTQELLAKFEVRKRGKRPASPNKAQPELEFEVPPSRNDGERNRSWGSSSSLLGSTLRSTNQEEAMCGGGQQQGAPAALHSPGASKADQLPVEGVTEEELMNSGHELHERYTCPLCCLPIALPAAQHSKFYSCCMKTVCNGCVLALHRRGMEKTCAFCRTPTADNGAAILALVQKRVDAKDRKATEILAQAYYNGNYGLQPDIPRAIELWTDAARLGDLDAHYKLGCRYCKGECVKEDVARSVRHWQHAAIQGHPESRYLLGVHEYTTGNHQLAVRHWMISAKMGLEESLNNIKAMFMKGYATKAQYAEALRGYQNALEETKSPQREEAEAVFK